MDFPYIKQIIVHNCYASKGFNIPNAPLETFKHIIITGLNGSGKTTILKRTAEVLNNIRKGKTKEAALKQLKSRLQANQDHPIADDLKNQIFALESIDLLYLNTEQITYAKEVENVDPFVFAFYKAQRTVNLADVKSVTTEMEFLKIVKKTDEISEFTHHLKQYLVNKKVYEAFDYLNNKENNKNQTKEFFENLTNTLRKVFNDLNLKLEFTQEDFEFYIILGDGRKLTFNQLSEGFSAFLSIILDLMIRIDIIRKEKKDFNFQPEGIVLIDEPETHLHLSMQYEMLPLISILFPKIQLIIATHSPAIISSLKDAIVFDLSTKDEISDKVLGSSYSELMITHFGLDNEYSPVADKIIDDVNKAVADKNLEALQKILDANDRYLTPVLKLDIEGIINRLNKADKND